MNLYQCREKAKHIGFDKAKFFAVFPAGLIEMQWIDAYMGLLKINKEGLDDGFYMVHDIDKNYPDLKCSEPFVDP